MKCTTAAVLVAAASWVLLGCGPEAQPKADIALTVSSQSEGLRETYRTLGVPVPVLKIVFKRGAVEILGFGVRSSEAVALWRALRAATEKTGLYPIIARDLHLDELLEGAPPMQEVLDAAAAVDTKKWLESRLADQPSIDEGGSGDAGRMTDFVVPRDVLTGRSVDDLLILLVPTRNGYEVPAFVPFGGWNDCPDNAEHIAVLKAWHEQYGAELVCMSGDMLEFQVQTPPETDEAARALAREQFAYCPDIIHQGAESLGALAGTLRGSAIWSFWWD